MDLDLPIIGSVCFGLVIGWMTCRVHHDAPAIDIKWLAGMIGTIGGGVVTALFTEGSEMFGAYCIGLTVGFFVRPLALEVRTAVVRLFRWFNSNRSSAQIQTARNHGGE
jgi:hypothetical protein